MSISTIILGESGTGKSASLRNMSSKDTLLIQCVKKPLPFKTEEWKTLTKDNPEGNIFVCDEWERICNAMQKTKRKIIVIDDFQYLMANEFMRRSDERGFDKFTEIAKHAWEVFTLASNLPDDVRVYILSHTQTTDQGDIKIKTIGKLLDDKITPEGLFSIVLRTFVTDKGFYFLTRNNGRDTVKTPIGLFEDEKIDNDLKQIDEKIKEYYGVK